MAGFDNDVVFANNVDFSGGSPVTGKVTTDGQLLIGATASPNIRVGNITSTGSTITVTNGAGTINLESGGAVATSFVTNQGTATPSSGVIDLFGDGVLALTSTGLNTFTRGSGNVLTVNALAQLTVAGNGTFNITNASYAWTFSTSGGTVTVNLPSSVPNPGKRFLFLDGDGNAGTNNITINGNGRLINGLASVVINSNFGSIEVFAINGTTDWIII